jgi:hypothetical protein
VDNRESGRIWLGFFTSCSFFEKKKFGRLPLTELLQPAIDYPSNGYPLIPILVKYGEVFAYKYRFPTVHHQLVTLYSNERTLNRECSFYYSVKSLQTGQLHGN